MANVKPITPNCTVAVHNGSHHADDVFCIAALKIIEPTIKVIRTRDAEELKQADFRVDVGFKYEPATGDYDHHQGSFNEHHASPNKNKYAVGPKMAGFGLIMRHYGRDVIIAALKERGYTYDFNQLEYVYKNLDTRLVSPLDAFDNGEQRLYYMDSGAYRMPSIIKFIQNYNVNTWMEDTDSMEAFMQAVSVAQAYLKQEITRLYGVAMAIPLVAEKIKDCRNGILVLEQYLPWAAAFSVRPELTGDIKMVVFPSVDGWMFQSPQYRRDTDSKKFSTYMANGDRRTLRYPAPSNICGKSAEELSAITGVPDARFVHAAGFIGACDTLEGALKMVSYIISNQEPGSNTAPNR